MAASLRGNSPQAIVAAFTLLAVAVRLYRVTAPLIDGYHERQAQTAMVTRNLYRDGLNFLYTRYDFLQGNSPGIGILEFPLHNLISASLYYLFGIHDVIGRLVSVAFAAGSVPLMYLLARRFVGPLAGLVATAVFAFSMTNIYLGRAVMPESPMMFFVVAGMLVALRWVELPGQHLLPPALLLATAFLAKTPTVLLLLPFTMAWTQRFGPRALLQFRFVALVTLALLPAVLWTWHASVVDAVYMPGQRPQSFLLARGGDLGLRLSPAFYAALIRSFTLLLTPVGGVLLGVGVIITARRSSFVPLFAWLGAWLIFIYAVPELNMQHAYYQAPMLPPMAILAGEGAARTVTWLRGRVAAQRRAIYGVAVGLTVVQIATYGYFFREAYDVTGRLPEHLAVAALLRQRTPPDTTLAIYDDGGGTVIAYYADRKGWGFGIPQGSDGVMELETLRQKGVTALVAVDSDYATPVRNAHDNPEFWVYLSARYKVIAAGEHFSIYDLRG